MIAQRSNTNTLRDQWFDRLLALSTHKFMLENDLAGKDIQDIYAALIGGNADLVALQGKELSQKHFIFRIIFDYLSLLKRNNHIPNKLAFDMNDTKVLVWAQVADNDEELEKQLILSEARINAEYHQYGYDMTSMIVEDSDNLPIPNHYTEFKYKG